MIRPDGKGGERETILRRVKSNCAAAIYNIAIAHEMKGDLFKAKEGYEKAAGLRPGNSAYIKML